MSKVFPMDFILRFSKFVNYLTEGPCEQFGYPTRFPCIKLRSKSPYLNKTILHNSPKNKSTIHLVMKERNGGVLTETLIGLTLTYILLKLALFKLTRLK